MTLELRIKHTTGYRCTSPSPTAYHEARVTPANTSEQFVLRSSVTISPTAWSMDYRDYWGTSVTAFEVHEPYEELRLVASSTVQVSAPEVPESHIAWSDLDAVQDTWCEYLSQDDAVQPPQTIIADLQGLRDSAATPDEFVVAVSQMVRDRIVKSDESETEFAAAAEVWQAGVGSCRDTAQSMIGALRWAGIPARYVSGYLHTSLQPAIGETVEVDPHAWLEWWDGEWRGHDPVYDIAQTERHVVVARGRDHNDNPPMRGIHSTSGDIESFVNVEITRLR